MKKLAAILLLITIILSLTACNSSTPKPAQSETVYDGDTPVDKTVSVVQDEEKPLYDANGIKVKAGEIIYPDNKTTSPTIELQFENTNEMDVEVESNSVKVNDIALEESILSGVLPAGETTTLTIPFDNYECFYGGITSIATVEVQFKIYDTKTYGILQDNQTFKIETNVSGAYEQGETYNYIEFANSNGVKLSYRKMELDEASPYVICYAIKTENTSDKNVTIFLDKCEVNGESMNVYQQFDVAAGETSISKIGVSTMDAMMYEIEKATKVVMCYDVTEQQGDSWVDIFTSGDVEFYCGDEE